MSKRRKKQGKKTYNEIFRYEEVEKGLTKHHKETLRIKQKEEKEEV